MRKKACTELKKCFGWSNTGNYLFRYFTNKGPSSQSYGFCSSHVWMWKLNYKETWVPKSWCFWTVVLEETLKSPWSARRSNQSVLKRISPEYSLEGLMLKLETPTLWPLDEELTHWKRPWFWERLKLGGEGDDRRWDGWMASSTQWTWVWVGSRSWRWTEKPGMLKSMGSQSRTWLSWTSSVGVLSSYPCFLYLASCGLLENLGLEITLKNDASKGLGHEH